ncbi:hypothetical protein BGZ79_006713 [Entomortierella chlamydospora]|nr:hypothetical protein BGZ79_006713 [Entomortierella chlamydospora]
MRCLKAVVRLLFLIALTALLAHGLKSDSFADTARNDHLPSQPEPEPLRQTLFSNLPTVTARKDAVPSPHPHIRPQPPSYTPSSFPAHKSAVGEWEPERLRDQLMNYDSDWKAMDIYDKEQKQPVELISGSVSAVSQQGHRQVISFSAPTQQDGPEPSATTLLADRTVTAAGPSSEPLVQEAEIMCPECLDIDSWLSDLKALLDPEDEIWQHADIQRLLQPSGPNTKAPIPITTSPIPKTRTPIPKTRTPIPKTRTPISTTTAPNSITTATAEQKVTIDPAEYYRYVNDYFNPDIHEDRVVFFCGTEEPYRPADPNPYRDGSYFYARFHGQGRQVNPEDNTLVRFQIVDHRLLYPDSSIAPSLDEILNNDEEETENFWGYPDIVTKYLKPRFRPQPIQVSDWYPASKTEHWLSPTVDYLREGEEPEVLKTIWSRLYWDRHSDSVKVIFEKESFNTEEPIKTGSTNQPRKRVPIPDLWKKVIRDTVRSSCDTANGVSRLRRTTDPYDQNWYPNAQEEQRVGIFPGATGDPSNMDGYFKEFTSPRCPNRLPSDRWPDYTFEESENPGLDKELDGPDPWSLGLEESASVVPKRTSLLRSKDWKGEKKEGPQTKVCKFWRGEGPSIDSRSQPKEGQSSIREEWQRPPGGYLMLLPEWRVVTGWIVITNRETGKVIEQHLVRVEVPEIQNDGSLQGETVCHYTP